MKKQIFLDGALTYLSLGFSVFPCAPGTKKPIAGIDWKQYQQCQPDLEHVYVWGKKYPDANIAVVTGGDMCLVVSDGDSEDGIKFIESFGIPSNTPIAATSRGGHYYFQCPTHILGNSAHKDLGFDIKAHGGYVLAPPSIHPDGSEYSWIYPPFEDFPSLPKGLKKFLIEDAWLHNKDSNRISMDGKKNLIKDKARWKQLKNELKQYPEILQWMKKAKPEARSGHDWQLIRLCLEQGITDDDDLSQILLHNKNGKTKSRKNPAKYATDLIAKARSKGGSGHRIYSLQDLSKMKFLENTAIIGSGVLNSKSTLILGGEGKIGKTMLYIDLVTRLAFGQSFLGLSTAKVDGVLVLQTENILPAIKDRINKLKIGLQLNRLPNNIYVSDPGQSYNLNKKKHRREIISLIKQSKAELVVLDPFIDFFSVSENDNVEMRGVLRCLNKIKTETGVAFILVHHFTKSTSERADGRNRLRGASSIFDGADTVLELTGKPNSTERILRFAKLRYAADRSAIYLRRDANLVHHIMSDGSKCPPEKAVEVLREDLSGRCKTKAELIQAICDRGICSDSTAKKGIQKAIDAGMIKEIRKGKSTGLRVS